jgi:glutamate dehydrogenase
MSWENLKATLLEELAGRIEQRAESEQRASLHNLATVFYRRFPAEDLRGRSMENLYGCLYGLLRFLRHFDAAEGPRVRILNPQIDRHGWESNATVLVALCRDMPFCTASVRGELNQRQLAIHSLASCNLATERDADGSLRRVLSADDDAPPEASRESLLYFELGRHSDVSELEELRLTVADILGDVARVVDDFEVIRERLDRAAVDLEASSAIAADARREGGAFLEWLKHDHATLLGYEYLAVARDEAALAVESPPEQHLGVLRGRETRGALDLLGDLERAGASGSAREPIGFGKSRRRSRVHRQAYPDFVEVLLFDDAGEVIGQHRFLILYTAGVYTMSPTFIPILRRKVDAVLRRSGLDTSEHDGRELLRVLELFPRDELFQSSVQQLYETAGAVNRIQERRRTRLFVRRDRHDKFVSCMVYMPRDRYTTERRLRVQEILSAAFAAEESEFTTLFTESILVRVHFVLRVDPQRLTTYDVHEIEEQIVQATLAWEDRLRLRLIEEFGEEEGERLMREIGNGFPPGYRDDFDPRVAVLDLHKMLGIRAGERLGMSLYRLLEEADDHLRLRLYNRGAPLPLSDVLPILENLGLRVVTERAYPVRVREGDSYWIQEFSLIYTLAQNIDLDEVKGEFEDAFQRIWFGEAESDSFNRLLLGSRLSWREIALLRAYAGYLRQINFPYSLAYIAETMADHLHLSAGIVEYFLTRFSPVFDGDEDWRAQREEAVRERVLAGLDAVQNLGQDRIIRQYLATIAATLRTNFFQPDERGEVKPYFSFKLHPADIPGVPRPVPLYEVYVYSPRLEGVHLRGGKVARGGLRWSDRLEDFRTEVLGLVKAQQVKNAVIVPVGAKGGFVCKRLGPDWERDAVQAESMACYKTFIRGLLDITDNRSEAGVLRPRHVVAKDDEDPYLVVAADKGTASFSDLANALAAEYDFWLGDAFASGGSVGYDHKKMGITARGAWVSVERHFRELGTNVATTPFTVVGIGDMSGDVFGNGMLLSPHIHLLAAFNHQHIFVDPEPDAASAFAERRRLFSLPRSSWADYDPALISEGGGVFSRAAKSVTLSPAMKQRFGIAVDQLTPAELISHLLRAPVDLLWNGGIGTWVKSSLEVHTDVGDKVNDSVRVNANELRCRVIGEGGNLGLTQLARVEFAVHGGHLNTDFIDNAGGVDCSDHEVNIKILLDAIVARGDLTEKHRNALLEEMTDSVASLVLANNYRQAQAISLAAHEARERSGEYRRLIASLEAGGRLDRELEFLPSDEDLAERAVLGQGLTRPELAVLVSYSKAVLKESLIQSGLEQDPTLAEAVRSAFPPRLVAAYPEDVAAHRLRREILCTQVANDIVNRMGPNFVTRQQKATGAPVQDVARAYTAALAVFSLEDKWDAIEGLDHAVEPGLQLEMMLDVVRLVKRATRWLLRNRRHELAPSALIEEFATGVADILERLPELLRGAAREFYEGRRDRYAEAGAPAGLAAVIGAGLHAATALAIIDVAARTGARLGEVAELYYHLGERLELDWYGAQILGSKVDNEWQAMARESYLEDLQGQQCTLASGILQLQCEGLDVAGCLTRWEEQEASLIARWREMLGELHGTTAPDFAMFAVANRELQDLAQSSRRS